MIIISASCVTNRSTVKSKKEQRESCRDFLWNFQCTSSLHVNAGSAELVSTVKWAETWQNQQNDLYAQRRLRLAWASAWSDKSLFSALYGQHRTQTFFRWTAKSLIRLGRADLKSSLVVWVILLVFVVRRLRFQHMNPKIHLSHVMRKPVYAICEQQRRRSTCASTQYDQCLCWLLPR